MVSMDASKAQRFGPSAPPVFVTPWDFPLFSIQDSLVEQPYGANCVARQARISPEALSNSSWHESGSLIHSWRGG